MSHKLGDFCCEGHVPCLLRCLLTDFYAVFCCGQCDWNSGEHVGVFLSGKHYTLPNHVFIPD